MIKVFVVSKGCMAKGRPWAYVVAPVGGIGWFVGVVSRVGWLVVPIVGSCAGGKG